MVDNLNDKTLQIIIEATHKNGYYFDNVTLDCCKELKNSVGFFFSSIDLRSGTRYIVYTIEDADNGQIFSKLSDANDMSCHFFKNFKEIAYTIDGSKKILHIFLHQDVEATTLKDYLQENHDDYYKLVSIYDKFRVYYNSLSKYHLLLRESNFELIKVTENNELEIGNIDYLNYSVTQDDVNVINGECLNAIWMLTVMLVATNNPKLLLDDALFEQTEKGISEEFLSQYVIPFLNNKEYRLLFSIIVCKQCNKTIEIEIDLPNIINTNVTHDDWKNAKKIGDGWYSSDDSRFYGVCNPTQIIEPPSEKLFRLGGSSLKLELDENETLTICDYALSQTNSFDDIYFSEGITTLGKDVFVGVKRIKRISLPKSIKFISNNPFRGVTIEEFVNLSPFFIATGNALYSYEFHRIISFYGEKKKFNISFPTRIVGEDAFRNSSVEEVTIDNSVEEIRDRAFYCCFMLDKISLPDSLIHIGREAFQQPFFKQRGFSEKRESVIASTLKRIRIPQNVKYIGRAAFNGISIIENDSPNFKLVNDTLMSVDGHNLIYYFGKSKKYKIPSGVVTVWESAFMGNEAIEEITIPPTVRLIESHAFEDCKELGSVVFDCDIISLGESAFCGCEKLHDIKMPKTMGIIKQSSFRDCKSLPQIRIPEGVNTIEDYAFRGCSKLEKVLFSSSLKTIGENAFGWCQKLRKIELPEGLLRIHSGAFEECQSLKKIILPKSLGSVDYGAFSNCSLQECVVSNTETAFNIGAFEWGNDDMLLFIPPKADISQYINIIPRDWNGSKVGNIVPNIKGKTIEELLRAPEGHYSSYYYDRPFVDKNGGVYLDGMQRLFAIEPKNIKDKKKFIVSDRTKYIAHYVFGENYSFLSRKELPFEEIVLPKSLKAIGDYCFCNSQIKKIKLPKSLEYIGDYAFMDCSNLSVIKIPHNVNHIGINPFYKSPRFYSYELNVVSESPHYIIEGDCLLTSDRASLISCFQGYKKVKLDSSSKCRYKYEIVDCRIPDGVVSINKHAFVGSEVKNIYLPKSVQFIEEESFKYVSFPAISIPTQVKHIGERAFLGCKELQKVYIKSKHILSLEKSLFDSCESLTEINIPKSVTHISDYAFRGCKKLSTLCLPASIETIGINPFVSSGLSKIICKTSYFFVSEGLLLGNGGKDVIAVLKTVKSTVALPNGVENICQEAFAHNITVEEVICPTSLKSIGAKAFEGCLSLRKVQIEDSLVEVLPESVFSGCIQLESVTLPATLSIVRDNAFGRCEKLQSLTFSRRIVQIGYKAFEKSGLKSVYLPHGFNEEIVPSAFRSKVKRFSMEDCNLWNVINGVVYSKDGSILIEVSSELEEYTIPESVEMINDGAFRNAYKLKKLSIPKTVKKIGNNMFLDCSFEKLVFPESITEIGDNLFSWYWKSNKLKEFIIPSSVKKIHGNPFKNIYYSRHSDEDRCLCKIMNNSESFALLNGVLYTKDLKKIVCCTNPLKFSIEILDTTEVIGYNAFANCWNMTIVSIPEYVNRIESMAFVSCHRLQTIRIENPRMKIDHDVFKYCDKVKRVIIPHGSEDWYKIMIPQYSYLFENDNSGEPLQ